MKKSMVDYMNTICDRDFVALKKIINHKFRKFRSFYWLLKDYTEDITELYYYDDEDLNTLKISVKVAGMYAGDLAEDLSKCADSSVSIENDEDAVTLVIYGEEEPAPDEEETSETEAETDQETN